MGQYFSQLEHLNTQTAELQLATQQHSATHTKSPNCSFIQSDSFSVHTFVWKSSISCSSIVTTIWWNNIDWPIYISAANVSLSYPTAASISILIEWFVLWQIACNLSRLPLDRVQLPFCSSELVMSTWRVASAAPGKIFFSLAKYSHIFSACFPGEVFLVKHV